MTDVLEYLETKHVKYKLNGSEVVIRCPHCNKDKLSINISSGLFHCFHCEAVEPSTSPFAKGHINKLKEKWGDIISIETVIPVSIKDEKADFTKLVEKSIVALSKNREALKYLMKERKFSRESIDEYSLGFVRKYNQDWISIPAFEGGIPKLVAYRKLLPEERPDLPKYLREEGGKSVFFNGDIIDDYEEIIICEGQFDALALLDKGIPNVIGMTVGAGTLKPEWYDKLILKKKIYLCLDADKAGQKAAKEVWATRLGLDKCLQVTLPEGEDVNSYFKDNTIEDFKKLLTSAQKYKIDGVFSLSETLYELYNQSLGNEEEIFPLPWPSVNKLINGGLKKKWMIVLGGTPKVGKTSMAVQICHHMAVNYNMPSFTFCLEMPEVALGRKVVQISHDLGYNEVYPQDALIYQLELGSLPMYFGYSSKATPEIFYNTVKAARDRYGIQLCVLDNLQLMVRSDKESDMGKASRICKLISMELNMTMIMVSQPRKLNSEDDPTYDVLKGSSAIPADGDIIMLLHRRRVKEANGMSSFEPTCNVIVDGARYAAGGRTKLFLNGDRSKFYELNDPKRE